MDHAVSDEQGCATLEAPPGTYRILVERMDLEPWTSDPLTVEADLTDTVPAAPPRGARRTAGGDSRRHDTGGLWLHPASRGHEA